MKKYFFTLIATLCILRVTAQAPEKISYQAVIRDHNQKLIVNQTVGLRITIMQGSSSGTIVYRETHSVKSNKNGLVTMFIGGGNAISGDFSAINWANGPFFLKSETDLAGGTNYTMASTNQLISVPYALYARTAGEITEKDPVFTGSVAAGITVLDTARWNKMIAAETDPLFIAWNKSTGIIITESQISNLQPYLLTETDPIFSASVAAGITGIDTAYWNTKLGSESDPVFNAWNKSTGIVITENQISNLQPYLLTETDPIFSGSVAAGITGLDTAYWNTKLGSESDPVFNAWNKSTGISITESQISNLQPYLLTETDPVFSGSVASGITGGDITNWNNKISTETDPVFTAWNKSTGIVITENQISNLQPYLLTETDPLFSASVAAGITGTDTANWNAKIDTETDPLFTVWDKSTGIVITESQISNLQPYLLTETDPLFSASVAGGITSVDTAKWNNMTAIESDPFFTGSVASGITSADTSKWNNMSSIETDPVFINSVAGGITSADTANWNQKAMIPGTAAGEMLFWNGTTWVMVPPGIYGQYLVFCNGVPSWGGCPPVVSTFNATSITGSSALVEGLVSNDGGSFVSERGICWGTSPSPTIAGSHLSSGTGTGNFQITITGLSTNTLYYARAYATNATGTIYGNEVTFNTTTVVVPPPQCDFTANPLSVQVNAPVQFTDLSTNSPTSWLWNFGNGNSSTQQNPSYTYTASGSYSITLTATNSGGSCSTTKTNYITVTSVPPTGQPCPGVPTVTDIDGNVYNTVQIGNQCWLQQNLKTTRYNNGTTIPIIPDNLTWSMSLTPALCWYNNDSASYHQTYGVLYNWYAVNTGNLCPVGWHEATADEWDTLANFVGGVPGPLKEIGLLHWASPNSGATNQTGFTALPGGGRDGNSGGFGNFSLHGEFWTSFANTTTNAVSYVVHCSHNVLYRYSSIMRDGKSVRCIADQAAAGVAPVSDFTANPLIINLNSPVQFTDLSTNNSTSWKWYFGDGNTSTQQNPSYTYTTAGTYTVSLVVANAYGSDSLTKTNYINVNPAPQGTSPVYDIDGNGYDTIHIGNQVWMKQNLKTTKYNNGVPIPEIQDGFTWSITTTPAMCWYNNDSAAYKIPYGALYNWYVVNENNLCPAGFHVPTDDEWGTLVNYVGSNGGMLKDIGLTYWQSPNSSASNATGFTAVPSGFREHNSASFEELTLSENWWSSSAQTAVSAWGRSISYQYPTIYHNGINNRIGYAVRCIMDSSTGTPKSIFSSASMNIQVNNALQFIDQSANSPTSWKWYFGDGNTSTIQNPVHTYSFAGNYTVALVVTNALGTDSLIKPLFIKVSNPPGVFPVYDIDGNGYDTVHIGTQIWMKQNLKTTRYANGTLIPEIQNNLNWSVTTTPAMCWYGNDSTSYKHTYGGLYNWYAVSQGNLCPSGWHVSTNNEWNTLVNYVGGNGGKLKAIGLSHWMNPNGSANNETMFTALPAGFRDDNSASFENLTRTSIWWSSTSSSTVDAFSHSISYQYETIYSSANNKRYGFSVRCIKD